MKTNKLVIGLVGLFIFAGCSGFNQDPLKGQDDAIRNATKPDTKLDLEKTITDGAVQLAIADVITFKEGVRSTYDFKVKTFLAGYAYSFEILNPDNFQGATIGSNNQLVWTPAAGTIPAGKGFTKVDMNVRIVAKPNNGSAILQTSQVVPIYIENDLAKPVIKSVKTSAANTIEEGGRYFLTVLASDPSSSNAAGMNPTLAFKGKIEPYVTVTSTRYLAATQEWEFELVADLTNAEITRSVEAAPFYVQVVDRLGTISIPYTVSFTLLTKLGSARSTFPNSTVLKATVANSIPFTIFDPNQEAIVTLMSSAGLPAGAAINCENATTRSFQQCILTWTPDALEVGKNYVINMDVQSKNMNSIDTRVVKATVAIMFNVVAPN